MTWEVAKYRAEKYLPVSGKIYGIPRGGMFVAALASHRVTLVDDPADADIFVDDIIDSGETAAKWKTKYGKGTVALVDKLHRPEDTKLPWIVFPWERQRGEDSPQSAVTRILQYLGQDVTREGLVRTPERVIGALTEMTAGFHQDPAKILTTTFKEKSDEMIVLRKCRFASLCEHHILPFTGTATIGYLPGEKVVGISKLARLLFCFSRRLQIQERLTAQIAKSIEQYLSPLGVGVILKAHHACMGCRGVNQPDAEMVTSAMLGAFRENPSARAELLELSR